MKCDVCGTHYTPASAGVPAALAYYSADGLRVVLSKTGHSVDRANNEGLGFYYGRVAAQVGGNPQHAGAFMLSGDTYAISKTGDYDLDLAVQVDAFANPEAYGLGSAGAPGVAAGPGGGPAVLSQTGDAPLYVGTIPTGGVNSEWKASNPEQVQYADIAADGTYSVVTNTSQGVYVGVGFAPGIATFADLKAGGVFGKDAAEVYVKAGQYLCFAHLGHGEMRACQR